MSLNKALSPAPSFGRASNPAAQEMFTLIRDGNAEALDAFLTKNPGAARWTDNTIYRNPPLVVATGAAREVLLAHDPDPNQCNVAGLNGMAVRLQERRAANLRAEDDAVLARMIGLGGAVDFRPETLATHEKTILRKSPVEQARDNRDDGALDLFARLRPRETEVELNRAGGRYPLLLPPPPASPDSLKKVGVIEMLWATFRKSP